MESGASGAGGAESDVFGGDDSFEAELQTLTTAEIRQRARYVQDEIDMFRSQIGHIDYESKAQAAKVKEGKERVKLNKKMPWLVSNVVEVSDLLSVDSCACVWLTLCLKIDLYTRFWIFRKRRRNPTKWLVPDW